ncbi:MAG: HD domain-containing phosphohydrolase, partial [Bacillota bacterium]
MEARDPYTQGHSVRVSRYAVMIGEGLGLTPEQLRILRYAGLLHDIGKLAVEDRILRKAGPLTPEERQAIKQHPVVGAAILGSAKSFA